MDSDSSTDRRAPRVTCKKCGTSIDASSSFCPHCGLKQRRGDAWYYHPVWICVLAFAVLGPFALYLVWKTPKMSRAVKAVLTVLILAYTGFGAYYFYVVFTAQMKQLSDLNEVLRRIK